VPVISLNSLFETKHRTLNNLFDPPRLEKFVQTVLMATTKKPMGNVQLALLQVQLDVQQQQMLFNVKMVRL